METWEEYKSRLDPKELLLFKKTGDQNSKTYELIELSHFENLQPMWGRENISKNNRVIWK